MFNQTEIVLTLNEFILFNGAFPFLILTNALCKIFLLYLEKIKLLEVPNIFWYLD
jgi:hypothetical protein